MTGAVGILFVAVALYFGVSIAYPLTTGIVAGGGYGAYWLAMRLSRRRQAATAPEISPDGN